MGCAGGLVLLGGGAGGCAAAVRSGKAGRLWALCRWCRAGAGAWSSGAAVCCWRGHRVRRWRACPSGCRRWAVRSAAAAVRWRGHRDNGGTTPSACRAADPAGRAGGKAGRRRKRKRPGRRRVVRCCSGLLSALAVRSAAPGASRCISWAAGSAPRSGAGLLALALIRAQRFQLATFQRGTACAGGAPSGAFLPFAGGVRFSTLPGSALGVGLELSEL